MTSRSKSKHMKIYKHFGQSRQIKKLGEEVAELIEAVLILPEDQVEREAGDVLNLLKQLVMARNGKWDNVEMFENEAVERTLERIRNQYPGYEGEPEY